MADNPFPEFYYLALHTDEPERDDLHEVTGYQRQRLELPKPIVFTPDILRRAIELSMVIEAGETFCVSPGEYEAMQ
jgi:hypothetical protein